MFYFLIGPTAKFRIGYSDPGKTNWQKFMGTTTLDDAVDPFLSAGVGSEYTDLTTGTVYVKAAAGTWAAIT